MAAPASCEFGLPKGEVGDFRDGAAEVVTTDRRKITIDAQGHER